VETFSEVRERAVAHIEAEKVGQPKLKESNRDQPLRIHETSAEKRTDSRYVPFVAKKDESRGKAREESQARPKFRVSYKELLVCREC